MIVIRNENGMGRTLCLAKRMDAGEEEEGKRWIKKVTNSTGRRPGDLKEMPTTEMCGKGSA